ncbi:MAG TPA: hypothetical protein VFF59_13160, partial [Anaerolineae bacterium]|nr:hypothetical protein [Anaerolineae bacterium]
MHILHGAWVVDTYLEKERGFIVWAETSDLTPPTGPLRKALRVASRPHPFAASIKSLRRTLLDALPAADVLVRGSAKDA